MAGVTALVGALTSLKNSLVSIASESIATYSSFEQIQAGLTTVLQSAEKGAQLFEQLRAFSFETTFGVDELASASTQLLNTGTAVEDLESRLAMLGDLAGGSKGKFAELVSIFGKIESTGRATSVQLNQLALRGIPIKQTLQDMGVTGVASAEQMLEAFQRLTAEGGQFHDAMNNIIDTIEGKQGFITDTLKELKDNFAEVTGLADSYKAYLDTYYEIVQKITDLLKDANENPLQKALLSGAIVAVVGGLAGVLIGTLVPALAKVATELGIIATLKSAINPTGALIGLGVGALVGAGVGIGMASYSNSVSGNNDNMTIDERYDYQVAELDKLIQKREELRAEIEADVEEYRKFGMAESEIHDNFSSRYYELEELDAEIIKMEESTERLKKVTTDAGSSTKTMLSSIVDDWNNEISNSIILIEELYSKTTQGKIDNINEQISAVERFLQKPYYYEDTERPVGFNGTEVVWQKGKKEVEAGQDEIDRARVVLQLLYDELDKLSGKAEDVFVSGDYVEQQRKALANSLIYESRFGRDYAGVYSEFINNVDSVIEELIVSGVDEFGSDSMNSLESWRNKLVQLLDITNRDIDDGIEEIDDTLKIFSKTTLASIANSFEQTALGLKAGGGDATGIREAELTSQLLNGVASVTNGTDVGSFLESILNFGDPLLALMSVMTEDLFKVIGGIEGLELVLNPILSIAEAFEPLLKTLLLLVKVLEYPIEQIAKNLTGLFETIFGDFADIFDEYADTAKEQAEKVKDLTNSYEKLKDAIRQQEEYYLTKKQSLNADTERERVNDAVIDSHGRIVSTAPNDWLIATKNPSSLGGGNISVKVINNNNSDISVSEGVSEDGIKELVVTVSRKVADDARRGANGWSGMFSDLESKTQARRVAIG